ncbi:MAG: UDP-N-acetylmuramoyl-tripeptide--D-alanyl-D-alanine ligase [Leptolyngbya sp. SIO4C1]|nr:UDP-N-acetylmuramoyl-tripeptide--D-alanyl-D-alanine ligase [Leptolyngbya sp. SIO4C1]
MVCQVSLAQVIHAIAPARVSLNESLKPPEQISVIGINTDSRTLQPGQLFVALEGERFNGHVFAEQAVARGAIAAVVRQGALAADISRLEVTDTLAAYQALGRWWRQQRGLPVVAITGSVGKTTTKELIAAALAHHGHVLKTQANYNNEIGVPKTLLELAPEHQFAVIEMGMRGPGEIALLTQIAQPDVAVITNVGTAHIGRLGSEQAIADAKCELLAELPAGGTAVLNYDSPRLMATAQRVWSGRQITYGLTGGDVQGRLVDSETLEVEQISLPLPLPGEHNALNLLAAIAVLQALNLDWQFLKAGLSIELPAGRAKRISLPNNILLLDETYNAGYESMVAALRLLAAQPGQRHIAVLGTMKELGHKSIELHHRVGQTVQQLGLDQLFILADPAEAQALRQGADPIPSQLFENHASLTAALHTFIQPGDCLLFKASRSVALDQVVEPLKQQCLSH